MTVKTDQALIDEVLNRSIDTIYPSKKDFEAALETGKQLSFYVGIDPTADYVHLGHSTNYLLMERLHKMGHRIIVLVGDFTAMIGDPSDKTSARVQLTPEEVRNNLASFKQQISKVLDFEATENPIEFKFNSEWLSKLSFVDVVELASNFTVQQMIERDAFKKRIDDKKPLFVHEFFYPLMQGYDSVAMDIDCEIGGTDQTFNMLAGRTLQKRINNRDKFVITTTLLVNPETNEKMMSKSLGTGIGLNESPKDMFGKSMRLPDPGIVQTYIDCTRLTMSEVKVIEDRIKGGENPKDTKLELAKYIVTMYHGEEAANKAHDDWISQFSEKSMPTDIPTHKVAADTKIIDVLIDANLVSSKSEARRLLQQNGIKVNSEVPAALDVIVKNEDIVQVGKRKFVKIAC